MKNQKLLTLLQADAVDYYLRQGHSIETARYMATYNHVEHTADTVDADWLAIEQGTFEGRQHAIHGLDPF
jgi:hypothetical protein